MSGSPRILFVVDAGAGHVMRCLTLAGALQSQGAACSFTGPPAVDEILETFAPGAARLPAGGADAHALFVAAQGGAFDAVVFDHDGLAQADHRAIARGCPAMVIDDLADRPLGADLLLNPNPERRADDYDGLLAAGTRTLFGPLFALVRPEFAALREEGLARRGEPVRRILVSMGLNDAQEATTRVLDRLRARAGEAVLDVTLGHGAPGRAGLERLARRDPRIALHVDAADMARLTAQADIAVGVAGSAAWERCTLGLPTILVACRPAQRPPTFVMAELDAALVADIDAADFESEFDRALTRLLRDPDLRMALAAASARLCDGQGGGRVSQALLALIRDTTPQGDPIVG